MQTKFLGLVDYKPVFEAMQRFTAERDENTPDELWLCEHTPVFTQGLAGKAEHILAANDIPVVQSNRGGQVTYHGPGQIVAYPLLDLRRRGYFVKEYVYRLEEATIRTLAAFGITGYRVRGAPGIYVQLENPHSHEVLQLVEADLAKRRDIGKIAALGIKVSQRGCYHGLSLNVAMDLRPFSYINPCGYEALRTIDMHALGVRASLAEVMQELEKQLQLRL